MTAVKMCGLCRAEDIAAVNELRPEYVGFVFAPGSRRRISAETAEKLRRTLAPEIRAVGVFTDARIGEAAALLEAGIIDMAQLHGGEDEAYIAALRARTGRPVIRAFRVRGEADIRAARASSADHILLDAGAGEGRVFDWGLLRGMDRPYFLAGGLNPENVSRAVRELRPFAVDVSSGIERDGRKDKEKMRAFIRAVREETGKA